MNKHLEPKIIVVGKWSPTSQSNGNIYDEEGLCPTIVSHSGCSPVILINKRRYRIRKLTPRECFRLFGLREAEIDTIQAAGISNTQQYKMAGNSIVVDVLYHIFRKLLVETKAYPGTQLELF